MLKTLLGFGLGWCVCTPTGRKISKNVILNSMPLIEKELGLKIIEPFKELTKDVPKKAD
jgi:hypothetical protein